MRNILLSAIIAGFISNTYGQVTDSVNVPSPGTLNTLAKAYLTTVAFLTVTGNIDARDFKTMRDSMTSLVVLNLANVTIKGYTGTNGTQDSNSDTYASNAIPQCAFYNSQTGKGKILKSIELPDNITNIGYNAFYGVSNLGGALTIPSGVTSIGDKAFANCYSLTSLTLSPVITSIGDEAFFYCYNLSGTLIIPSLVTSIGTEAFYNCDFTGSLNIPSSVSYIGVKAFTNTPIASINADTANQVYSSIDGILYNKKATLLVQCPGQKSGTLNIPSSVTTIGYGAFQNCYLISGILNIPSSVDSILNEAFYDCSGFSGSLNIPSSVKFIGNDAFGECTGFSDTLTIPSSVQTIQDLAFFDCTGLTSILTDRIIPLSGSAITTGIFSSSAKISKLYVPCGSIDLYKDVTPWNNYNIAAIERFVPITVSADTVIMGALVTFTADTDCLSKPVSLHWEKNGKFFGNVTGTFSYNPSNGDTIICLSTIDDTTRTSNSIVVTVLPAKLSVSADTVYLSDKYNSTAYLKVISNTKWIVIESNSQTWLTIILPNDQNADTSYLEFIATANTIDKQRIDTVYINASGTNITDTIFVIQNPGNQAGIMVFTGKDVSIYPNPTTDFLTISVPNPSAPADIFVYNLDGIELYSSHITCSPAQIDMSQYSSGIYIVKILTQDKGTVIKKIIRQ